MTTLALGPRTVERPGDGGWTLVGTLDGVHPARLDNGGLINPAGAPWSLDWWIGADDRWYLPAQEPTVRQRRQGAGPVIETTVRIPSGDARQVVYGAVVDGREMTVVEVHNESPVPVALALAVRPYDLEGRPSQQPLRIEVAGRAVRIDSRPALLLPRPANEAGGSVGADLLATVQAGLPLGWEGGTTACEGLGANVVVLYPLPHRTSLRFLLPAGPDVRPVIDPAAAPDADAVARGWGSVIDAAGRLEFPDSGLTALTNGARARLLLTASELPALVADLRPGAGAILHALAVGGHGRELGFALDALAATFPSRLDHGAEAGAEIVAALGPALQAIVARPGPELLEVAAQLTHLVERSKGPGPVSTAKRGLANLARLAGDEGAAAHLERGAEPARPLELAAITTWAEQASSTGSWSDSTSGRSSGDSSPAATIGDDAGQAARFLIGARSLLIDDHGSELVLLPRFPTAWRGGNVEVHEMPTRHGELSFGIRWHGARPALLWQLDGTGVTIRCPGLDPDWSTVDQRGETLLAGSADGLLDVAGPGDSFS